jgi:heme exporter protein C
MQYMHKYASPKFFYTLAGQLTPWMAALTALLLVAGLYLGLFIAPADYQQGESYRIMFIHVPAAWMSMFIYVCMAGAGAIALVWNVKLFEMFAGNCAPVGASFTFLALVTGSLWGKPMWGTWWAWDARLTSELILFFLYIGYMALEASIDDPRRAARASDPGAGGRGQHSRHPLLGGVVEYAASAGLGGQSRNAFNPPEHACSAAADGLGLHLLFLHGGVDAHAQ